MGRPPEILLQKLLCLIHRSLVEVRKLTFSAPPVAVADLADTFEVIPELMARWENDHLEVIRAILQEYQAKYPDVAFDYLSILDMDDAEFLKQYQPPAWDWETGSVVKSRPSS